MKQKLYIGCHSLSNLAGQLAGYRDKTVFLVRGKESYSVCGAEEKVGKLLKEACCKVVSCYDFEENPKEEDLRKCLALFTNSGANIILAVGGGSVLDMAKLIRFSYAYSGEPTGKEFFIKRPLLPLIAIPTTSGTGSEATQFAVLYKDGIKYSVSHPDILPDVVIIYPPFTYEMPAYITACTGFDALAQAIEAYWNINANETSDIFAFEAVQLIYNSLRRVLKNNNNQDRERLSKGAYLAGRAINITRTSAPHAFSYYFTSKYKLAHGHAVALTFPFFWKYNLEHIYSEKNDVKKPLFKMKMNKLISLFSNDISHYGLNFFEEYIFSIGLCDIMLEDLDLEELTHSVSEERLKNNPVHFPKEKYELLITYLLKKQDCNYR